MLTAKCLPWFSFQNANVLGSQKIDTILIPLTPLVFFSVKLKMQGIIQAVSYTCQFYCQKS